MNRSDIIIRHTYWWRKLQDAMPALAGRKEPSFTIDEGMHPQDAAGSCAHADGHCTYYLAYAETAPDGEYDVTICHELCHAAVLLLNPWARRGSKAVAHGELWQFLFNTLMRQDRGVGHSYDVVAARNRAKELLS